MKRPFDLDEWLKDKSQQVVDKDNNPVTIFFSPLGTAKAVLNGKKPLVPVADDELVGVYKAVIKGYSCNPTLCRGKSTILFFKTDSKNL